MLSKSIMRTGSEQPLPTQVPLCAGPLSLIYENGDLRYVRLGQRELLRRIYVAVRDHNWDTVHPMISNLEMQIDDSSFVIAYTARHQQGDVDFMWRASISGADDGSIEFCMDGEALSTFRRNRIGLCVLHPMSCAGDKAFIDHTDGTVEGSRFPLQIAPQLQIDGVIRPLYPFADMRALTHQVTPHLVARVGFKGDVFEMEDQRNWTDASFKSYSTPLQLPFPVEVASGTKIVQTVTLTLDGAQIEDQKIGDREEGDAVLLVIDAERAKPLPPLGLGVASHDQPLSGREIELLRALNLSHLRIDLQLAETGYVERLTEAIWQADALNVQLEVGIFVSDDADGELSMLRRRLDTLAMPVCRWLIFHRAEKSTSSVWVDLAQQHLGSYAPAKFGAGSSAYFAEINRCRPHMSNIDFITYSLNPQVHAFDNASLVETLEAQAATVDSVRHFAGGNGIIVSPVTLRPRFNPNATGPGSEPKPGTLPPTVDPRQMSLFGAAWTVGSLKHLLGSGLEAVTYFETTGWRGVLEQEVGCPLPAVFCSEPGMAFPLYHALADVGEFAGGEILAVTTSDSLSVDCLAVRRGDDAMLLVANFTSHPQQARIEGLGLLGRLRLLDESTFAAATGSPQQYRQETRPISVNGDRFSLDLAPYSIVRIDTSERAGESK
jgi:hypothetical protein